MWDFWCNEAQKAYQLYIVLLAPPFAAANPPETCQVYPHVMRTSATALEIRCCYEINTS